MNRVSLLVKVKTRDPGGPSPDRDFGQNSPCRVKIYCCVIPTKTNVPYQDHVSHERWKLAFPGHPTVVLHSPGLGFERKRSWAMRLQQQVLVLHGLSM